MYNYRVTKYVLNMNKGYIVVQRNTTTFYRNIEVEKESG